jgi:hypothetical protein
MGSGLKRILPSASEKRAAGRTSHRGRHDDELKVRSQGPLHFMGETKREVCIDASLVEFIEDNQPNVSKLWIGYDTPGEDPLSEDLYRGLLRDAAVKPYLISDALADSFAEKAGHLCGNSSRGNPAGLEHKDLLA